MRQVISDFWSTIQIILGLSARAARTIDNVVAVAEEESEQFLADSRADRKAARQALAA